jgi:hypothetical protein
MSNHRPLTSITIVRNPDNGQVLEAYFYDGLELDTENILLDVYRADLAHEHGYQDEVVYGDRAFVQPAQIRPEVLIASWITEPPTEPTVRVNDYYLFEEYTERMVDAARENWGD